MGEKKLVTREKIWEAIAPQPWPHRQRYHQGWGRKIVAKSSNFINKQNCSADNTVYHNSSDCQKLPKTLVNSLVMRVLNLREKLGRV
ncbi:hypothetical protein [Laspinema palackyanum]|uniref:hypothetical protein n=1 Tax=Laspinema palackyanum TaxID=3231601 RepID=UPI00345C7524